MTSWSETPISSLSLAEHADRSGRGRPEPSCKAARGAPTRRGAKALRSPPIWSSVMTLESDVGRLKNIKMFHKIDAARLKLIALMSERVQYIAGDRILRQGQKIGAVYFILSGEVD